ncbi:MAG TPA: pilus assembly protein N-terminal domain-containing protein [Terriglobales bacterium]|nr:pilus assembly protein N-terminal domain-containing protein [Terriglobales bacterium]
MRFRIGKRVWWAALAVVVGMAASSCSGRQRLSPEFKERLNSMREESESAMNRAMERQILPEHAVSRRATSIVRELEPGAPVWIQSGKSQVIRLPAPARRVSIGDPDVAGLVVLGPDTIIINGKTLPEDKSEQQRNAESGIRVSSGIYIGRTLTSPPQMRETTLIVWGDRGVQVHPLIVASFMDQQVMLEVTVAEVNRTALEQHGIDFRVIREELAVAGWLGAGVPPGPEVTIPPTSAPLLPLRAGNVGPTYALIFPDENVSGFIQALQTEGLATVLARPKLTAMSGQMAVFQVGGEIPIRIVSGFTADIQFKPFGTLINFIPRITDDGDIFLTVTPEVSEADFSRTVDEVPTFRTRRASTTTRLKNGETLVISGLLQERTQEEEQGVPYLKDIPFLGYAFRGTSYSRELVELMIVVKPTIVSPLPPGSTVALPNTVGPLTREEARTTFRGDAEVTRPRLLPAGGGDDNGEAREKSAPVEETDPLLPGESVEPELLDEP